MVNLTFHVSMHVTYNIASLVMLRRSHKLLAVSAQTLCLTVIVASENVMIIYTKFIGNP